MRWLEGPVPARRLGLIRAVTCGFATVYLLTRTSHVWAVTRLPDDRFDPVGVVSLFLDRPLPNHLLAALLVTTVASGIAATLGWKFRLNGPLFALLLLITLTYRHSWGQVLHTENLMVLHVLVLGFSRSADAVSLDAASLGAEGRTPSSHARYGWPLQLMTALTAITYAIAAWAKIRNGGLEWMTGDVLRNQVAYDNLRKHLLGDYHSAFGGWLTQFRWMFPPMAAASMLIEIGALVAIPPGRHRNWWGPAAWLFHIGVLALMAIFFPYQLFGVAFLSLYPVERWWDRFSFRVRRAGRARRHRREAHRRDSSPGTPTSSGPTGRADSEPLAD